MTSEEELRHLREAARLAHGLAMKVAREPALRPWAIGVIDAINTVPRCAWCGDFVNHCPRCPTCGRQPIQRTI